MLRALNFIKRKIDWLVIEAKELRKDPCIVKEYNGIRRSLGSHFIIPKGQKLSKVSWYYDYEFKNVFMKKEYLVYDTIGLISKF